LEAAAADYLPANLRLCAELGQSGFQRKPPMSDISLEPRGDDYAIVRVSSDGKTEELLLSADNVLTLAQSAQLLQGHILSKRSRIGAPAVFQTSVAQVRLNTDAHVTEIHLTMIAQNGAEATFSLPLNVAKPLAERLPARIAEIENQKRKHTKQ
jgi:hypothetical protein